MRILVTVLVLAMSASVAAQEPAADAERLFEAGQYQQVIAVSGDGTGAPTATYLAALSHEKLGHQEEARRLFQRLADQPGSDAWHFVGESGVKVRSGDHDGALATAREAVRLSPGLALAHYQLGLVLAARGDYPGAASAFDAAKKGDADFAYAYFQAGQAYYRMKRVDVMASNFETFLKLAPTAPERPEVESLLRTLRGR